MHLQLLSRSSGNVTGFCHVVGHTEAHVCVHGDPSHLSITPRTCWWLFGDHGPFAVRLTRLYFFFFPLLVSCETPATCRARCFFNTSFTDGPGDTGRDGDTTPLVLGGGLTSIPPAGSGTTLTTSVLGWERPQRPLLRLKREEEEGQGTPERKD